MTSRNFGQFITSCTHHHAFLVIKLLCCRHKIPDLSQGTCVSLVIYRRLDPLNRLVNVCLVYPIFRIKRDFVRVKFFRPLTVLNLIFVSSCLTRGSSANSGNISEGCRHRQKMLLLGILRVDDGRRRHTRHPYDDL